MTPALPELSRGVWGVLATPFLDKGAVVDLHSFRRQIAFYQEVGAAGIVALGVFGEAVKLSAEERLSILETTATTTQLPIVVGITSLVTQPTVQEAKEACDVLDDRLAGLMVQVNSENPDDVIAHLTSIHHATGAGIVLQDYPLVSSVHIAIDDLVQVMKACPFLVAVKAEAPPTPLVVAQLTEVSNVPIFGGLGGVGLIDELAAGAAGAMTGFSHPEGLMQAVIGYQEGEFDGAYRAFKPWLPLANFEGQAGIGLAIRKEVLRRRGIIEDSWVREPGLQFPGELDHILDSHLTALESEIPSGGRSSV